MGEKKLPFTGIEPYVYKVRLIKSETSSTWKDVWGRLQEWTCIPSVIFRKKKRLKNLTSLRVEIDLANYKEGGV